MLKSHRGKIVHLRVGNIIEWFGEYEGSPEPNWYRFKNPCRVHVTADKRLALGAVQGTGDHYLKVADVRIPEASVMEVLAIDPNGELYQVYQKEIKRKKSTIIESPGLIMPGAPGKE